MAWFLIKNSSNVRFICAMTKSTTSHLSPLSLPTTSADGVADKQVRGTTPIDALMGQVKAGFAKDTVPSGRPTLKLPVKP